MVMVFAGGHVSGGHYNPAVSTAVFLRGKMSQRRAGGLRGRRRSPAASWPALIVILLDYDPDQAAAVAGAGKMLVVEFLFTFALAYVVLNVATAQGHRGQLLLRPGDRLHRGGRGLCGRRRLRRGLQPRGCDRGMVMGLLSWGDIWIYLIAHFAGGAAAAAVFLYTQPGEKDLGDVRAAEPGGDVAEGGRV